ncbi:aminopeptidase [Micromonospora sp. DT31]|uniref:aminopeptidase n=1 Tax=Micromonospora sp. DT31 TaxID=3393434 RepID=UPI003CEEFF7A
MRLPTGLLLTSAAAGLASAVAATFALPSASSLCGLVALLALLGYVLTDRGVRPVTWPLAAGVGVFTVVTAARLFWPQEQFHELGLLAPGGTPAVATRLAEVIEREKLAALGTAAGVVCLAAGVLALPVRRPGRGALTTGAALLLLVWFGVDNARTVRDHPLPDLLGTVWPALLATLAALGALAVSGWRTDRRWLLPSGLVLLSLTAAQAYAALAGTWSFWRDLTEPAGDSFLEPGMRFAAAATDAPPAIEVVLPLVGTTLAVFAATALVVAGALGSARETH